MNSNKSTPYQSKKRRTILSVGLIALQCIYVCVTVAIVFNPFGVVEKALPIVVAPIAFVTSVANDVYVNLKYNETWIEDHTKEEIIKRYGEFDAYEHNTGYYKTREISGARFDAVAITFGEDGTVTGIAMDSYYAHPGG